jgi:hypothetical protein
VASRKKKLARHGVEKNANGHRFRVQKDSWKGTSTGIREGSQNGTGKWEAHGIQCGYRS